MKLNFEFICILKRFFFFSAKKRRKNKKNKKRKNSLNKRRREKRSSNSRKSTDSNLPNSLLTVAHETSLQSNEIALLPDLEFEGGVEHHWGGCADNVQYGYKKSRRIMDRRYRKSHKDIRTLVMLHNNEAGRLVSAII